MSGDIKINASDIQAFVEDGDVQGTLEEFIDGALAKAVKQMNDDKSSNFVIGKVIIENDLEDEDEDEESSED
jgi:uncharacterized protein YktB (UPF0637 family)